MVSMPSIEPIEAFIRSTVSPIAEATADSAASAVRSTSASPTRIIRLDDLAEPPLLLDGGSSIILRSACESLRSARRARTRVR